MDNTSISSVTNKRREDKGNIEGKVCLFFVSLQDVGGHIYSYLARWLLSKTARDMARGLGSLSMRKLSEITTTDSKYIGDTG